MVLPDSWLQQIKDWLKNHSKSGASGDGKPKLLDLNRKKGKKLPLWQAYTRLYYESDLKDIVEYMWWMKYLKDNPEANEDDEPPAMPLAWRNETIAILFEDETQEVKDECQKHAETTDEPVVELPEEWETEDPDERKRRVEAYGFGK
jgi:hypothetical protein